MLTKCIECELPVSDKAASCPHCGYPLHDPDKDKRGTQRKKRMRLPNGFGQISEIKNRNLRNPFRVMVSQKDEDGKTRPRLLQPRAYFPTYNDAYTALAEYNRNPYDLEADITVKQLYEIWFAEYEKSISSKTSIQQTMTAWRYCSEIYDMRVRALRPRHIKKCMEEGTAQSRGVIRHAPPLVQTRIKTLFNLMLDYAVEYEIVDINHSRSFKLPDEIIKEVTTVKNGHIVYTEDEMRVLWEYAHNLYVDMVLVQCYSGWRPQELLTLKVEDVDLEGMTFRGGMKTESGKNRVVPIHSRISDIVRSKYTESCERGSVYLFGLGADSPMSYMQFSRAFNAISDNLGIGSGHRLHDGRTHFVTAAKKYGVDEYAIKYMVGHKISDITEAVYTKRGPDWLREQIEKIE